MNLQVMKCASTEVQRGNFRFVCVILAIGYIVHENNRDQITY